MSLFCVFIKFEGKSGPCKGCEGCKLGDEKELKKAFKKDELQIYHIDNNGHHNTLWNGNLIALPKSIHEEIHKIKDSS